MRVFGDVGTGGAVSLALGARVYGMLLSLRRKEVEQLVEVSEVKSRNEHR
jgi:hypothetical protein